MMNLSMIRTALFVPGNRPDRVDKAVRTIADAVIIDLEDAVPYTAKQEAREIAQGKILQYSDRNIFVRINALDSEFIRDDLKKVAIENLSCIIVPKIETGNDIRQIDKHLFKEEKRKGIEPGTISIIPLIESASAVENAFQIASIKTDTNRLFTLAFGAADFTLDMGISMTKTGEELFYPRARIAIACRAANIMSPLDTPVMIDIKDTKTLEADVKTARQLGFQGKLCIHPIQLETCNRLFSPTEEEIESAQKVVRAFDQAEAAGSAVFLMDGQFVDRPVVERSKRILQTARVKTLVTANQKG